MHKIKREIGIVMLARARYRRTANFWRFSSKVSKRSKATRRQKSSKWSKALGLLAEAKISQKWSKFSRLQNPTLRLCGWGGVRRGPRHFRRFKPISWGTSGGLSSSKVYMHFRRAGPTSGGLSLPHGALPVRYPPLVHCTLISFLNYSKK